MIRFLVGILLLFFTSYGFSSMEKRLFINTQSSAYQERRIDIEEITDDIVTEEMFYSLPVREKDDGPFINLLISDSVIYAFERCRLNVWKWENEEWVNLYRNNNKGLCMSTIYLYEGKLLGFTSDGFWFSQSAIYVFSENLGEWELRNVTNEVPPFLSAANFKLGRDTVISFSSVVRKNGAVSIFPNAQNFGLDLKTDKWFKTIGEFDLRLFREFSSGFSFDMENTVHVFSSDYHVVIDKKTKQIYFKKLASKFISVNFYFNDCSKGIALYNDDVKTWQDIVPEGFDFVGKLKFKEIKEKEIEIQPAQSGAFWQISLLLLVLIVGFVVGKNGRRIRNKLKSRLKPSLLLLSVLEKSGHSFSSDEMDELINIEDDDNSDSRRVKRSRIIQELNAEYLEIEGKEVITRQKDPKDKRYVIFYVQK